MKLETVLISVSEHVNALNSLKETGAFIKRNNIVLRTQLMFEARLVLEQVQNSHISPAYVCIYNINKPMDL